MPKETFFNLAESKKELIISAAIQEFGTANYNSASINQICKKSRIAKGSFYQYFADKLDLYVYVMTLATQEKIQFFSISLEDSNAVTLVEQIQFLFTKGVEFVRKYPQFSALGEQFSKEENELAKAAVIGQGEKQSESLFIQMIHNAKTKGEIDEEVDSLALCVILKSMNSAVNEYMRGKFGNTNYESNEADVNVFINSLLRIICKGIQSKK